MPYSWITPKTNWKASDYITYTDYNRIRNNLLFINDQLNAMFPDKAQTLDLGNAKTGYSNVYHASEFNAFEDAIESFARVGTNVSVGTKKVYKANGQFIGYQDLNRIESCCLKWKAFEPSIESATLSPDVIKIKVGETQQLTINVVPPSATYTVTYKCDNTTAATVDANGLVTGVGDGQFTITATVKSGKKTFTLTVGGRIQSESIGSYFMFNNQKYFFDLVYVGKPTKTTYDTQYYFLPRYRTSALASKWGDTWTDAESDYRTVLQNFIDANFSQQLKKMKSSYFLIHMYENKNGSVVYKDGEVQDYYMLPAVNFYSLKAPSNADPKVRSYYRYTPLKYTDAEIDGEPLITGRDKGQLVQVRLKDGDNYTMARLMGSNIYPAERDEVLPIRPILVFNGSRMYVYSTPNADGSYSIDWTGKSSGRIPVPNLPKGTIIRDDTGTGRTG